MTDKPKRTFTVAILLGGIAVLAGTTSLSLPAAAHPHVFVDAREEVLFDTSGRITGVRNIWQFDEAFSAFAIEGSDADGDGKLSEKELQPLAKINVDSLAEFAFFTYLNASNVDAVFVPPTDYGLAFDGSRLTLTYTLPIKEPVAVGSKAYLEIFDPGYFVAFEFLQENPAGLIGAPAGCEAVHHRPKEIDAATMDLLNQIPADKPVPPELLEAARALANYIAVECSVTETASLGTSKSAPITNSPATAVDAVNRVAEAGDRLENPAQTTNRDWRRLVWVAVAVVIVAGFAAFLFAYLRRTQKRAG